MTERSPESFDTIIIGGGPAGLSCALELQESRVSYVLLERSKKLGGQVADIRNAITNFAVGPFENGPSLRENLEAMAKKVGCNYRMDSEVSKVDLREKTVECAGRKLSGRTLVLSTGYRLRRLSIKGEENFVEDVCYHVPSNSDRFAGVPVAVVGGGDNALIHAIELAARASQVYLIHRTTRFKARPDLVQILRKHRNIELLANSQVRALHGERGLEQVTVISTESGEAFRLPVKGLLIKVGYAPNTELFVQQVDMDESGHILIDENCETSQDGVFAAGDITNPGYPRIATALGHGALTACGIRQILEKHH